jgi:hypothetical protein
MIIPIPTSEPLSTLFATTAPYDTHRNNNAWLGIVEIGTASFNVLDLLYDSVPYSIYTSQPYCASQIWSSGCIPDSCPTTLPYRPLIVLSSQLLNNLDPAWATCSLDLRGLYDPPKALQPATAIVVPTQPGAQATTSATPASGLASATPDPTAHPEHEVASATSIDHKAARFVIWQNLSLAGCWNIKLLSGCSRAYCKPYKQSVNLRRSSRCHHLVGCWHVQKWTDVSGSSIGSNCFDP